MVETKPRRARADDAAQELLSIDEVNRRYPNEKIVLKVAKLAADQRISHGYVLAHTRSRKVEARAIDKAYAADPKVHLYLFFGGTCVLSREEWQRRLGELPDEPYLNAHW